MTPMMMTTITPKTKPVIMVTSLGPWGKDWSHAHGYSRGQSTRSFHRAYTEFPHLIKQEISFLKYQFWKTERILLLTAMYNIIQYEDMENKDVLQLLRDTERKSIYYKHKMSVRCLRAF